MIYTAVQEMRDEWTRCEVLRLNSFLIHPSISKTTISTYNCVIIEKVMVSLIVCKVIH